MAKDYAAEMEREHERALLQKRLDESSKLAENLNIQTKKSALEYVLPGAIGGGIGGGAAGYGIAKGLAKRQAAKAALTKTGGEAAAKQALEAHFGRELALAGNNQKKIDKVVTAWNNAENQLAKRVAQGKAMENTAVMMTPAQMMMPLGGAAAGSGLGAGIGMFNHYLDNSTPLYEE